MNKKILPAFIITLVIASLSFNLNRDKSFAANGSCIIGDTGNMPSGTYTQAQLNKCAGGSLNYLMIQSGATLTVNEPITIIYDLTVDGIINHTAQDVDGVNITARNINISSSGSINTNELGCSGGAINGNGYGPNISTGVCTSTTSGYGDGVQNIASKYAGGAGHGSTGGASADGIIGASYDSSIAPSLFGSGGGGASTAGGNGGGKIRLELSGTLTVNGNISANGGSPTSAGSSIAAGGGSGGSIYIRTDTILGSAKITADGGNGGDSNTNNQDGAGGSGGRVALYYNKNSNTDTSFNITNITANKGLKGNNSTVSQDGNNGSTFILSEKIDNGTGNLSITSGLELINGIDYTRTNIIVYNGAVLNCGTNNYSTLNIGATDTLDFQGLTWECSTVDSVNISAGTFKTSNINTISITKISSVVDLDIANDLTLNNLTYTGAQPGTSNANGGLLSLDNDISINLVNTYINSNISFTRIKNLTLDTNSSINANSKGCNGGTTYGNGYGPANNVIGICIIKDTGYGIGFGDGVNNSSNTYPGGGGHGGTGGASSDDFYSETYGLSKSPTLFGSGGGARTTNGGNGGGKIRIDVKDTLTLNGLSSITANGGDGIASYSDGSGGGSGGSIYITTYILATDSISADSPAPLITSNGGNGANSYSNNFNDGSGGGGGRIAIYYKTLNEYFSFSNTTASKGIKGDIANFGTTDGSDGTVFILKTR